MSWLNSDGLYIKFAKEEGDAAQGGEYNSVDGIHTYEFKIDYSEMLSATHAIVNGGDTTKGSYGVVLPEGLRITEVETFAQTAFTSSGTIGSATMDIGLKKRDRSTELDHNGLVTARAGSGHDAAGELEVLRVGSTGAGALVGTTLTEDGIVVAANLQHGSHPYTAGVLVVRVRGYFP